MKKIVLGFFFVLLAILPCLFFTACEREEPSAPEEGVKVKFDIKVVRGDDPFTRLVQADWEDGDMIYVFFRPDNNKSTYLSSDKYVKLTYNEGLWEVSTDGSANTLDYYTYNLPGKTGTMYAVYFPFGNVAHPSTGNFRCNSETLNSALNSLPPFSFYMIDTGSTFTTSGSVQSSYTLYGTLTMVLPENFVYFYIDAADGKYNQDGKYRLSVEGIKPATVTNWSGGSFSQVQLGAGEPMWGFKYGDGICFAGIIDDSWATSADHRFIFFSDGDPAVTKTFSGISLASHESVKLKAPTATNGWSRLIEAPEYVDLAGINWAKWNLGCTSATDVTNQWTFRWSGIVPNCGNTEFGSMQTHSMVDDYAIFDPVRAILGADWRMPTCADFNSLFTNCSMTNNSDYFTFTSGDKSITFPTKNALYGQGGQLYMWTSEAASSIYAYVVEYHVGEPSEFHIVSSGNADAVRRFLGQNFIRPIYISDEMSVSGNATKDGYTPTPLL